MPQRGDRPPRPRRRASGRPMPDSGDWLRLLQRLPARVLLAQHVEHPLRAALAHEVLELGAEVRDQADALDHEVDDAPGVALLAEAVIDQDVLRAAAAEDLRGDAPVAARLLVVAGDLDPLV